MPEWTGDTEDQQAKKATEAPPGIILAERYRILPGSPLPDLDAPGTLAFDTANLQTPSNKMFARICLPETLPRRDIMPTLRHNREIEMMRPVEWGAVDWPSLRRKCFAVVFDRPERGPLVVPGETRFTPLSVADLTQKVMAPTALALAHLARRGIAYRAIRPDNLYGGAKGHQVLLGECVTSPTAFGQHAAYESIEMAMTPPLGRGPGTLANDMYALGATVMTLALGRVPFEGLTTDEIIAQKLARGSFTALLGGERMPFGLREALRGLLADEPKARWGLAELQQWLGGGANKSVPDETDTRMDRPFVVGGKECWGFRETAHVFGKNWSAASTTVLNESFMKWAKRGLGDADLARELGEAVAEMRRSAGTQGAADARLVMRICAVFDPTGPMRYKGVVAMPEGLGPLLADAILTDNQERTRRICELLVKGLHVERIIDDAGGESPDVTVKVRPFRQVQQLLRHTGPGYGRERCLYELNPSLPCQSKAVELDYVETAPELLPALERAIREHGSLPVLFDRHLAAFIASHVKRSFDRDLAAMDNVPLNSPEGKLVMVRILAWLQNEYGPRNLPHLGAWLSKELDGAADRFSSRELRSIAHGRLEAVAESGDLNAIVNALTDRELVERDIVGRRNAVARYRANRTEIMQLESNRGLVTAQLTGWRLAAELAWVCAAAAAIITLMG